MYAIYKVVSKTYSSKSHHVNFRFKTFRFFELKKCLYIKRKLYILQGSDV